MAMNEYGLDFPYFDKKLKLVVRDLVNYTPEEMFNELSRLAMVAASQANLKVKMDIRYPKPIPIKQGKNNE